jgi:hypothetical protein
MNILSDEKIAALIAERKTIPDGLCPINRMIDRCQHRRKDFTLDPTATGNEFMICVRQSKLNANDFSVILGYKIPGSYSVFRLRRYNGSSHQHTNTMEKQTIDGFHVHMATERYQRLGGAKEDHFAETTNRYYNLESAIACLLTECGFKSPLEDSPLFTRTVV